MISNIYHPLVTVGVVCYNAEEFIEETLDSVYKQTYSKIELIISDDHSSDNTVQKINEWVPLHKERFIRVKVITSEENTGVSGNGNRAIHEAKGEWYNSLDGDDLLTETAVEDNVNYVTGRDDIHFVFGNKAGFYGNFSVEGLKKIVPPFYPKFYANTTTAKEQLNVVNKFCVGSGSSIFFRTRTLKELGGYDERFPLMEDHPIYIKFTRNGYKLWLLDKVTHYYRINDKSISHTVDEFEYILTNNAVRQVVEYKHEYLRETYGIFWKICLWYTNLLKRQIINKGNSKKNVKCLFWHYLLKLTDPYNWYFKFLSQKYK